MRIRAGFVLESFLDSRALFAEGIDLVVPRVSKDNSRLYNIMVVEFQSEVGVVARAHDLVQLLPRTNADNLTWQLLRHRLGEVDDPDRRYLRHEDTASLHALERLQDEVDALIQRNLEPGHARVRDERVQAAVRQRVLGLFERRGLLSRETVGVKFCKTSNNFSKVLKQMPP